jgi:ABC-type spermidine/putrescine transport system permease subunit I
MGAHGSVMQLADQPRVRQGQFLLLLLPAGFLLVLFIVSLGAIANLSVNGPQGLTLEHYARFLSTPVYAYVLYKTVRTATAVTFVTLILAYPLSYLMSCVGPRTARVLTIAVVLPFFTSVMVRTFAWIVILGRRGFVNEYLGWLGVIDVPLNLLYNPSAVLLGMTYVMLPYMILTLHSVMRGIDHNLLRAAQNLGAGSVETFWRVVLPLTLPGIMSGSLLVFLLSLGFFITPALMGGPADLLVATVVQREIELTMNWGFGCAMAMTLLAITLLGFVLYYRLAGFGRLLSAEER